MIKLTIVLLIGLAAVAALRKSSAALRHWVLTVSIVCAALMPVLQRVVPTWHLPARLAFWTTEPIQLVIPVSLNRVTAAPVSALSKPAVTSPQLRLDRAAAIVWTAGTAAALLLLAVGWLRLSWLASRSTRLTDGSWAAQRDALSRQLGVASVDLLQSPHPALLATFGWLKPRVLLPSEAGDWPAERIRIVLAHELAHVSRRDWLVQLGASIFQALYWFNPIVWIACRTLRRQSELACDDAVLRLGVEAPTYAEHLLEIARDLRGQRRFDAEFPALAMARRSSLERRVRAMLNTRRNRVPVSRLLGACAAFALVVLVLPVAGVLATGQASTARFVGLVMDTVGRPLPHLTLVLSRDRDRAEIEAVSDDTGRFEFRDLTPGEYVIRIERPGFDRIQGRIVLYAGQDLEQDIALQVGTVQEEITVTASANAAPPPPPPPPPPPTAPAPTAKRIQRPNEPCGDTQIAGCLDPPIKLHDALPEYPSRQRAAGVEAHVRLEGRIGVDGFVKDLHLAAPVDAEFANAATSAVSEWRFVPTRLGGVPVETPMKVSVNFLAR